MSSHREAPEISKDPVADNTDLYAFVSPNDPSTVTIVANFIPLEAAGGGPNFFEFGDDVLYSIYIDNDGDAEPEIEYQFQFTTTIQDNNTFLYNTGPITSLSSPSWNRRQFYSVARIDAGPHAPAAHGGPPPPPGPPGPPGPPAQPGPAWGPGPTRTTVHGSNLPCPPCNVGVRSTPNYETALGLPAVQSLAGGTTKVFCGQRADPFYVDLGSIFDLGALRPFNLYHLIPLPTASGIDSLQVLNVHSIVIQVPITQLTSNGMTPSSVTSSNAVLGVWSAASRRAVRMLGGPRGGLAESGPWVQVSRLGNPLFNEVIVPMSEKDTWNSRNPSGDSAYLANVQHPELAGLIYALYPDAGDVAPFPPFPNLGTLLSGNVARADLVAILLTGIPSPIISGFQNYTGTTYADMLRLNVAIGPARSPNSLGLLGGDLAGFPNGRRLGDDVVAIELQAIAGVTYHLVDSAYLPDAAAGLLTDGTSPGNSPFSGSFPYVGSPYDGYDNTAT